VNQSNGTRANVKCPPIVCRIKNIDIKEYAVFENWNLLYDSTSASTINITGMFSGHQTALSYGLIASIENKIIYMLKSIFGRFIFIH
jgi:hypothetical protein